MALIAAVALGLALDRWREAPFDHKVPGISYGTVGASSWLHVLSNGRPSCYIIALTLVLIPLRWRRPRPPVTRILRQPGTVACLATIGAIATASAILIVCEWIGDMARGFPPPTSYSSNAWYWSNVVGFFIPAAVGGAWAALALGGRWSPERSWLDRAGRVLGFYWLVLYFLCFFWGLIDLWFPYKD